MLADWGVREGMRVLGVESPAEEDVLIVVGVR
jgi:hypothetical protein